jgi:uncharacterized protein YggU (UPF0235/DUF167 family)
MGVTRLEVWAKPGSAQDAVSWDPWRRRWVVSCRAAPVGGEANRAILASLARWLSIPESSLRWVRSGTSRAKLVEVDGLDSAEVTRRLDAVSRRSGSR